MPLSDKTKSEILAMIKKDMQAEMDAAAAKKSQVEGVRASALGFYIKLPYIKNPYLKLPYLKI